MILEQQGNCNCDRIVFLDTKEYQRKPENTILKIIPPDFTTEYLIPYNANAITLIKPEHISQTNLLGGLYNFTTSRRPNSKTEESFCYLNICPLVKRIANLACEEENLEELVNCRFELEVAQDVVDKCPEKSCEIYSMVSKKLDKLEDDCKHCK